LLYQRGEEGLLSEPRLTIALEWHRRVQPTRAWAVRYHPNFEGAVAYLENSVAHRHRELAAAEELRARHRKLEHRTIWLMLATAAVTASAMLIWAWLGGALGN
jgi:hypothetical protein